MIAANAMIQLYIISTFIYRACNFINQPKENKRFLFCPILHILNVRRDERSVQSLNASGDEYDENSRTLKSEE
jgi:hypothetical protein